MRIRVSGLGPRASGLGVYAGCRAARRSGKCQALDVFFAEFSKGRFRVVYHRL